ncbi:protein transport protein SEC23 [Impatiens glandulifera]|uniref:protein transport protein SEC23 n=1 Tax=Impatiens glandulifera TaxID=253017 RepID=UPI001FB04D34|nr:protein transport protein SEC23 [Impatiens glandulifera]
MDFVELEAAEGLRWTWNSWPATKSEVDALVIPLSVMCTPLMQFNELPILPYDPLICNQCGAVLNPYARVDYQSRIWVCPFCTKKNPFPRSYSGIGENNLPGELFPTYSTVEYHLGKKVPPPLPPPPPSISNRFGSSGSLALSSSSLLPAAVEHRGIAPAFVFVVDACTDGDELLALKNELLYVVSSLPENSLVGLVTFDSMVRIHDLSSTDCLRVFVLHGDREQSSDQMKKLLGIDRKTSSKQGFLLPLSECEFNITTAIEDIHSSTRVKRGHRSSRSTGAAISASVGLLEGLSINNGSRILVFTSGPATLGPGMIVKSDLANSIRSHQDIFNDRGFHYAKASGFYKKLSERLSDSSIVLDFFACSLDQVGAAEVKVPVENSGGFMMLGDSFESEEFRKSLRHLFDRDKDGSLKMCFDVTIEIVTSKDFKVFRALGPITPLKNKNGTWKLGTVTSKTCVAFFFQVADEPKSQPNSAFFLQIITRYRDGDMSIRKRVTTASRRWVTKRSPEISSGFDQEAAACIMARLAIDKAESEMAEDVIHWLDKMLVRFSSRFGDYIPEDSSTFQLSSNFSLYPQFMYHLRRSQFIVVFNSSPDETGFFRLVLNREGVLGSLIMIQPTLLRYSFHGPPVPVVLDVCSITPDSILLFDSFFHVVIHYGAHIGQWRKMGYDQDMNNESLRKMLEEVVVEAEQLTVDRFPVPKVIKCDQYSSQARFLLAKLNPSVTHDSVYTDQTEIIYTDDMSLQTFVEHLRALAVQG